MFKILIDIPDNIFAWYLKPEFLTRDIMLKRKCLYCLIIITLLGCHEVTSKKGGEKNNSDAVDICLSDSPEAANSNSTCTASAADDDAWGGEGSGELIKEGTLDIVEGVDKPSSIPSEFKDMLVDVIIKGIQPSVGKSIANKAIDDLIRFASHGLGVGFEANINAVINEVGSINLEALYHRSSGAGEIGFVCSTHEPSGVFPYAYAEYYFVKTIGCEDTADYEGGFLKIPFSLGKFNFSAGLGTDSLKMMEFVDYANGIKWNEDIMPGEFDDEMERFNSHFVNQLLNSGSPVEIISISIFLLIVNSTVKASESEIAEFFSLTNDKSKQTKFSAAFPETLATILKNIVSLEVLKSRSYPSFKRVYNNLLSKMPSDKFTFLRKLLEKFNETLRGCDSLAFGPSSALKGGGVFGLGKEIGLHYYTNPNFLGFHVKPGMPEYEKDKKLILDINNSSDFLDSNNYEKLLKALKTKIVGDVIDPGKEEVIDPIDDGIKDSIDVVKDPPPDKNQTKKRPFFTLTNDEFAGADIKGKIIDRMILRKPGSLSIFLEKAAKLVDSSYLGPHCIKPSMQYGEKVRIAIGDFFTLSLPLPDTNEQP